MIREDGFDLSCVQLLAEGDKIAFKRHAIIRMHQREIKADDVKLVLLTAEVVEEYLQRPSAAKRVGYGLSIDTTSPACRGCHRPL